MTDESPLAGDEIELSAFQVRCEAELAEVLGRLEHRLVERSVSGHGEHFVSARVDGTQLFLYLYADAANVLGPDIDVRLEADEFDDEAAFRTRLDAIFTDLLTGHRWRYRNSLLWLGAGGLVLAAVVLLDWWRGDGP